MLLIHDKNIITLQVDEQNFSSFESSIMVNEVHELVLHLIPSTNECFIMFIPRLQSVSTKIWLCSNVDKTVDFWLKDVVLVFPRM